jgi:hypothetical protein
LICGILLTRMKHSLGTISLALCFWSEEACTGFAQAIIPDRTGCAHTQPRHRGQKVVDKTRHNRTMHLGHPPYSPDLSPRDFSLHGVSKN